MAYAFLSVICTFIFGVMLSLVFIIGLILIIIGLFKKHKNREIGSKYFPLSLIVGLVFISIVLVPLGIIAILIGINMTRTAIQSRKYTNIVDRWKNERVQDEQAISEAFEVVIACLDDKNADCIYDLFAEDAKKRENLYISIEKFIELVLPRLSSYEKKPIGGGIPSTNEYGKMEKSFAYSYAIDIDGQEYILTISAEFLNTEYKSSVGLGYIGFKRAKDEEFIAEIITSIDMIFAKTCHPKWIFNALLCYKDSPNSIDEEEFIKTVLKLKRFGDIYDIYGEPNIIQANEWYYRLNSPYEKYAAIIPALFGEILEIYIINGNGDTERILELN